MADAKPVFEARCVRCHSSGGEASNVPLASWSDLNGRRGSVLNQVYACAMPPAGEPQLTPAERRAVLGWLICGAQDD